MRQEGRHIDLYTAQARQRLQTGATTSVWHGSPWSGPGLLWGRG